MFFRSPGSLVLATLVILVGGVQLFWGFTYSNAAKRETSAVGTLSGVHCGRSGNCTYTYVFPVDQLKVLDESDTCDTALSLQGCKTGEPVRVYYDPDDPSVTNLEEFSAAARGRLFFGTWMVSCGLILIGLYFILNRVGKNSGESDDPDGRGGRDETEVLHVAPDE